MCCSLYTFCFFSEWYGRTGGKLSEYRYNLVLFKEIRRFLTYRETLGTFAVLTNVVGNVVIFWCHSVSLCRWQAKVPSAFLMTVCYSFGLSLCVEVFQLLTRVGSFDVDDLLLNTIGGLAGYILFVICNAIRRRYHAKK